MNNPAMRFKRDDGTVFPDWSSSEIGNVADTCSGGTPSTSVSEYWDGPIQWLTPTEINSKYVHNSKRTITSAGIASSSAKLLPIGALLLTTRATIGACSINNFDGDVSTNQGFQSLICKSSLFNEYAYYAITRDKFQKELIKHASGSTFLEISSKNLKKLPIPIPCLEEQQKVASFFSTLDQKIELNERKLEALEKLKKGIGRRLLIKDPESQLENSHWKIVRISEVADLITGFPFNSSDFSKSGIRLMKGANIKRGTLSFDQKTSSFWPSDAGLTKYALETGDLLVQMDGALVGESFGRVTEDLLPALLVQRVTRIRATEDIIEIIYQIFCIGNFLKFVQSVKTNTAIPHISLQNIKDFEISIPEDVNELHKLANFFRLLDAKINLVKRKKELYTYLKSGFLQQMFI